MITPKPNIDLHYLNRGLILLSLALTPFLFTSLAHATGYSSTKHSYWPGDPRTLYHSTTANLANQADRVALLTQVCTDHGVIDQAHVNSQAASWAYYAPTWVQCAPSTAYRTYALRFTEQSTECPANQTAGNGGLCQEQLCPEIGTPHTAYVLLTQELEGWSPGDPFPNVDKIVYDGCEYINILNDNGTLYASPGGTAVDIGSDIYWREEYYSTGAVAESSEGVWRDDTHLLNEPFDTSSESQDTRINQTTAETGDLTIVSDDGAGTVVTSQTQTDTQIAAAGTIVNDTSEGVTVTKSDGVQKVSTKVTTTTTRPDNTYQEVIDQSTSYVQTPSETYYIDKSTSTVTKTVNQGSTTTYNTTTIKEYDNEGQLSSTSTEGSTTDTEAAAAEDKALSCEENPNQAGCIEFNPSTNQGSFDTASIDSATAAAWSEIEANIDAVKADLDSMFSFDGSGSNLSCYAFFSYEGNDQQLCLSPYSSSFATIGQALLLIAMIIGLAIIIKD